MKFVCKLPLCLMLLTGLCVTAPQSFAEQIEASKQFIPVVTQEAEMTLVLLNTGNTANVSRFEFGTANLLDSPQITHTFLLRNSTLIPITLAHFQPSCRCTTALIERTDASLDGPQPILAPGQQVAVRVTVTPEPFQSGPLDKTVQVYAQGISQPVATLEIRGKLLPCVVLSPQVLNFGEVAAGNSKQVTLTAEIDTRLMPAGEAPVLISDNPDIRIAAPPQTVTGNTALQNPALQVSARQPARRVLVYQVTLSSDASLGTVQGVLRFRPIRPSSSAADLSNAPPVMMTGQVTGEVAALPSALVFGAVRSGQPATGQLILSGFSAKSLRSATVGAASPYLTAQLKPETVRPNTGDRKIANLVSPDPVSQVLEVTLSEDAPPGILQSQIKVLLTNGQHLLIPVRANVSAAGSP